jgi:reactive intermediate/imine deaminase
MNPAGVLKPLKPHYSNCVRVESGPLLFIAGQVALDSDGKLIGKGDIRAQAKQVLENIRKIVEANGATMADIVKVTVYVRDIEAFHSISDIRVGYFPKDGPASAIVEVSGLADPEFLVEIEAVAAVP